MNTFSIKYRNILIHTFLIFSLLFITTTQSFSQADSTKTSSDKIWKFDGTFLFHIHESTFTNWASGGENQMASKLVAKPSLAYDNGKWSWENTLDLRYGQQRNTGNVVKKNEDEMLFTSKVGKRFSEKWKFSSLYTFNSQFTPYRENGRIQSEFMAPAYTNLSIGFDYDPGKNYTIYMTPLNMRNTWVFNDSLSARGEYMVKPGSSLRFRFGPSFLITYKGEIVKNIHLDTKLGYFQDVVDGLGDPVVNWDALFNMKVNKFISASFSFTLFYDEDSKTDVKDTEGNVIGKDAKIQFKQSLGVGFNFVW
jgi:hypothetical protein